MPGSIRITLKLDIQLPDGSSAQFAIPEIEAEAYPSFARPSGVFVGSDPGPGDMKPVRLNSGDPTGLGSICAWVKYPRSVYAVKALSYPSAQFPASPPATPDPASILGVASSSGTLWSWSDNNMVPGADHAATPGKPNVFAVWYQDNLGWHFDQGINFFGIDSLSGPCPPLPFSGPTPQIASVLQPSILIGESSGFDGPHAMFNSLFALQKTCITKWHNKGDGNANPEIILTHDGDQRKWTLSFRYQQTHKVLTTQSCLTMGPLLFTLSNGTCVRIAPHY